MSKKQKNNGSNSILELVRNNSVPLMFIIICAVCIPISGFSPGYLLNEIVTRLGRNAFLILSLLIPIMAGMGLNFGMTLGAMAGVKSALSLWLTGRYGEYPALSLP